MKTSKFYSNAQETKNRRWSHGHGTWRRREDEFVGVKKEEAM